MIKKYLLLGLTLLIPTPIFASSIGGQECIGSIGSQKNLSIIFTGKMDPGDIDNGYSPYCVMYSKLLIKGKFVSELSYEGGLANEIVLGFPPLNKELASRLFNCGKEGIAGDTCIRLIPTNAEYSKFYIEGHPEDSFTCQKYSPQAEECH